MNKQRCAVGACGDIGQSSGQIVSYEGQNSYFYLPCIYIVDMTEKNTNILQLESEGGLHSSKGDFSEIH